MSKLIKIDDDFIEQIKDEFALMLSKLKVSDGKISFTKSIGSITRKATVYFTETAWYKMQALISEFDKEVAWHGIAERGTDPDKDEYIISDILVYPQEVTGTTVNTDQLQYQNWLMSHDDEVFNRIRMQGHSHVNMSTSPSSVDTTHQESILEQLDDTMFYIFMIWNKRGEKNIKIYDLVKNVLFETSDVDVKILENEMGLQSFLKNAKEMVKTKTYTAPVKNYSSYGENYYSGEHWCDDYYERYYGYKKNDIKKPEENKVEEKKTCEIPVNNSKKKRKGKRKK